MSSVTPAAVVIPLRAGADGPYDILMIERAAGMAFAGGAMTFPGGKVEPGDGDLAADPDAALRRAAVRETAEEVGLALDPAALIPFAHWVPPEGLARRFDTRFYLGVVPPDSQPCHDGGETVAAGWVTPADALARAAEGAALLFPTRCILERMAAHPTLEALLAHAAATPVARIQPAIVERDGATTLSIPEGLGYPLTALPLDSVRRA